MFYFTYWLKLHRYAAHGGASFRKPQTVNRKP